MNNSNITIMGSLGQVALGIFTATGSVTSGNFDIVNGNVTSFAVGRFLFSHLFVGFHLPDPNDITATTTSANWLGNSTLGSFTANAAFSSADPLDTASFEASDVVAANLGTVTIAGLDASVPDSTIQFGVAFRTGQSAGTVQVQGATLLAPPPAFHTDAFHYLSLAG